MLSFVSSQFEVLRDNNKCIKCQVCVKQCANEVHKYDKEDNVIICDEAKCVCCHRCVALCPTKAIKIRKNILEFKENANWTATCINEIYKQAESGGMLLSSMGNPKIFPIYWDKILLNASQVTNPSIDQLREPMETKVIIGRKPDKLEYDKKGTLVIELRGSNIFSADGVQVKTLARINKEVLSSKELAGILNFSVNK